MSSTATELHQMASAGRLLAGVVHEINYAARVHLFQ